MSPNTTPTLPSVNAQKPEVFCPCPSWASVVETLTMGEKTLYRLI